MVPLLEDRWWLLARAFHVLQSKELPIPGAVSDHNQNNHSARVQRESPDGIDTSAGKTYCPQICNQSDGECRRWCGQIPEEDYRNCATDRSPDQIGGIKLAA